MMSFRNSKIISLSLPPATVWLLSEISEAKGRQHLYTHQSPQLLARLLEVALIQSVESSNRIEGVTVPHDRLEPLVIGHSKPRDRAEHEIQGYRKALSRIHANFKELPLNSKTCLTLHKDCQESSGDAGQFKRIENDIIQLIPGEAPRIRFKALPSKDTPAAMDELCLAYGHVSNQQTTHSLVAAACFVLDFLCIHPFRDGNGRVSRLITLLALYQHGYEVGRYISLERLIEESKEDYYQALHQSSQGWHEARHDILPWLNYFLSTLRRAYQVFEQRVSSETEKRGVKTSLIENAIKEFTSPFTLKNLIQNCPTVSKDMIQKVLKDWQKQGRIHSSGKGPGATWAKIA